MKSIKSLNDLFVTELANLLNAEDQLVAALPGMAEASQSLTLKFALEVHLEITKGHTGRLQDIFNDIGQDPQGVMCKAMKGLIEESKEVVDQADRSLARDASIISVVKLVERYEIVEYQMACEHAFELNYPGVVKLLRETLDEEQSMYLHLNELAQGMINAQAMGASKSKGGGFYIPEGWSFLGRAGLDEKRFGNLKGFSLQYRKKPIKNKGIDDEDSYPGR